MKTLRHEKGGKKIQHKMTGAGDQKLQRKKRHRQARSEAFLWIRFLACPVNLYGALSTITEVYI